MQHIRSLQKPLQHMRLLQKELEHTRPAQELHHMQPAPTLQHMESMNKTVAKLGWHCLRVAEGPEGQSTARAQAPPAPADHCLPATVPLSL